MLLISQTYKQFRNRVRGGNYGKTAQFWLAYHLDVIAGQHLPHMAIQENNFYPRLHGLKRMLPFFFALNKQNYARYGSLYVHYLENLDATHPGLSVTFCQGQDRYPARLPTDQRGRGQTINRDVKTAGRIKFFVSDESAILKWTLNRSAQAVSTAALYRLADVKSSNEDYKSNRPSRILS